jgi:hypothetical protein
MTTRCIERRIELFERNLCEKSIGDYFGIPPGFVDFHLSKINEKEFVFIIRFCKTPPEYDFAALPIELSRIIAEYNKHFINLNIKIVFPESYPFCPPVWSLQEAKYNVSIPADYYAGIIECHNRQYKQYWSPAIHIEQDILYFIERINHFEYLL